MRIAWVIAAHAGETAHGGLRGRWERRDGIDVEVVLVLVIRLLDGCQL